MKATVHQRFTSLLPAGDDHPYRSGAWRPQSTEWDASDLDVVGEIPADLAGVYLRNTENPVHDSLGHYHPFDGDGMIHMIRFRDGREAGLPVFEYPGNIRAQPHRRGDRAGS